MNHLHFSRTGSFRTCNYPTGVCLTGSYPNCNRDANENNCNHFASSQPEHVPSPPPPITQTLFDRLNASLDQKQSGKAEHAHSRTLVELGQALRQWRLQQGYTRTRLATTLQIDQEQLTCIENGIATAEQIAQSDLLTIQSRLNDDIENITENQAALTLSAAIQRYLALPEP